MVRRPSPYIGSIKEKQDVMTYLTNDHDPEPDPDMTPLTYVVVGLAVVVVVWLIYLIL